MKQEISVTRALAEVKSLRDRIQRATSQAFITHTVGGKHANGAPVEQVAATIKAQLQSVKDLMKRRAELKAAIVTSNAVTQVVVAGQTMTVAEAIERKSSIELEKGLLATLKQQRAQAISQVERINQTVSQRMDQLVQTAVGKDRKVDDVEIAAITGPFEKANKAELLDPSNLEDVISKIEESVNSFELDVDFALNEVNAVTKITV